MTLDEALILKKAKDNLNMIKAQSIRQISDCGHSEPIPVENVKEVIR